MPAGTVKVLLPNICDPALQPVRYEKDNEDILHLIFENVDASADAGALWQQIHEISEGVGRPQGAPVSRFNKVGIVGAGRMGAAIASVCLGRGISVVLKDVSPEKAEQGKNHAIRRLKEVSANIDIQVAESMEALQGCDLVIEAVYESQSLKARITAEVEAQLEAAVPLQALPIIGTVTSSLPITELAKASGRPANYIGIHFMSPADRMLLVEIICGAETSHDTLTKAYDFVRQIGKIPILINDGWGFFTPRVFGVYVNEAIAMLREGIAPESIEEGALSAGYPAGPLAVSDEISLCLFARGRRQHIAALMAKGGDYSPHPADAVVDWMLEEGRPGKVTGKGFYEYTPQNGKYLWPGLRQQYRQDAQIPLQDIRDRFLFIQALEAHRCLKEGVLTSERDANIGSVLGFGYPAWTGGAAQFINVYGKQKFAARAKVLADTYGERFLL